MTYFGSTEWYQRVSEGLVPGYVLVDKWGRNGSVGSTLEPIISPTLPGLWQPTTASTVRVQAGGNANDAAAGTGARTITIEGLDDSYDLVSESITLAGASASASTSASFIRVHRAYVTTTGTYGGANEGEIIVEDTAGTVNIITIDFFSIGMGQSLYCAYSSPKDTTTWLIGLYYTADTTKTNNIRVVVSDDISTVAAPFGSQRILAELEGIVSSVNFQPSAPVRLHKPGNTGPLDVCLHGAVSAGSSPVSARLQLLLQTV